MSFRILLTIICLSISLPSLAAKTIGRLMVVKGKVYVQKEGKKKKKRARVGMKVKAKDTIVTEKDSRAKVVMVDKNVIHVSPASKMNFEKYVFQPGKGKKDVLLNVIYGKVRSNVQQKYDGKKNRYQVKTKAAVAGVRGTDFLSSYSLRSRKAHFVTFEGMVEVGVVGPGNQISNVVRVAPGQVTYANFGAPPAAPEFLSEKQLATINQDTLGDSPQREDKRVPANEQKDQKKESDKKENSREDKKQDSDKKKNSKGPKKEARSNGPGGGVAGGPNGGPDNNQEGGDRSPANAQGGGADPLFGGNDGAGTGPGDTMMYDDSDHVMQDTNIATGPDVEMDEFHNPSFIPPQPIFEDCQFCRETIENGKSRLIINIINQ